MRARFGRANRTGVTLRRLLPLLTLLALVFAPFGRIAAAEAMAMPHHQPIAMAGHCENMPAPDDGDRDKVAIDCMIACAVMAAADGPMVEAMAAPASRPARIEHPAFAGLHPEADPPPPRIS